MSENVRFQICRLSKFLIASIERTNIRTIASVNTNMSAVFKKKKKWIKCCRNELILILIYRKLKSSENLLPQPSKVHCRKKCIINLLLSLFFKKNIIIIPEMVFLLLETKKRKEKENLKIFPWLIKWLIMYLYAQADAFSILNFQRMPFLFFLESEIKI